MCPGPRKGEGCARTNPRLLDLRDASYGENSPYRHHMAQDRARCYKLPFDQVWPMTKAPIANARSSACTNARFQIGSDAPVQLLQLRAAPGRENGRVKARESGENVLVIKASCREGNRELEQNKCLLGTSLKHHTTPPLGMGSNPHTDRRRIGLSL